MKKYLSICLFAILTFACARFVVAQDAVMENSEMNAEVNAMMNEEANENAAMENAEAPAADASAPAAEAGEKKMGY